MKKIKRRNWAFILYPESAPENWIDILIQTGLPFAVSPLHDKDINPDGDVKKPHYHVILCYAGPTTYDCVYKITHDDLGQTVPQPLEQVKGYYRYFTHKDNPEKFQYDESEIITYNGFNISDFVEMTRGEVLKIMKDLQILIISEKIYEYCDLCDFLLEYCLESEYDVAVSHTMFFDKYITSRRHSMSANKRDNPSVAPSCADMSE